MADRGAGQQGIPAIGTLSVAGRPNAEVTTGFLKGLEEQGFVEGRSVRFLHRGAERYDEFVQEAKELGSKLINPRTLRNTGTSNLRLGKSKPSWSWRGLGSELAEAQARIGSIRGFEKDEFG
jgi:hypothetical protein